MIEPFRNMAHCSVYNHKYVMALLNELLLTFLWSALHEFYLWHNPHCVYYNSDTCLTMPIFGNAWNTSIFILQTVFTQLVRLSYQNKQRNNTNIPECMVPSWLLVFISTRTGRLIVKLDRFHVYVYRQLRAPGNYQTEEKW